MKMFKTLAILALGIAGSTSVILAEEAAPSAPTATPEAKLDTPALPLFPQIPAAQPAQSAPAAAVTPEPTPATSETQPVAPAKIEKGTADGLRQAIKIHEFTARLRQDPAVQAEHAKADAARTSEGRRTAMRNYYTLLYTKMEKLDPSLHDAVEGKLSSALHSLEMGKIQASTLVEPIAVVPGSRVADHTAPADDTFTDNRKIKKHSSPLSRSSN